MNSSVTVDKPKSCDYPTELKTIGDHIKKRRLDLGLFLKEVARIVEVSEASIWNWEKDYSSPMLRHYPKIIEFLDYNPLPTPETFVERLTYYRFSNGYSVRALAKILNICPDTLYDWERGLHQPSELLKQEIQVNFEI